MSEAVIVSIGRTPIGRAVKGSLIDQRPDDLGAYVVNEILKRVPQLDRGQIDDVICGCALPGGEWISTLELEAAILTHPVVREAAVIAVPDERWGERPMACVVPVPGQSVTPDELRTHLSSQGVVKWWLPDYWAFVDEVPRTSVGKYDKKLLRARNAEGSLHAETSD